MDPITFGLIVAGSYALRKILGKATEGAGEVVDAVKEVRDEVASYIPKREEDLVCAKCGDKFINKERKCISCSCALGVTKEEYEEIKKKREEEGEEFLYSCLIPLIFVLIVAGLVIWYVI